MRKLLTIILCLLPLVSSADITFKGEISGLSGEIQKNVLARLDSSKALFGQKLSYADTQALYRQGPREIRKAVAPFGYFKPNIQSALVRKGNTVLAYYHVKLGQVTKISHLTVRVTGPG